MRYRPDVRFFSCLLLVALCVSLIANVAEAAQACVNMHFGGALAQAAGKDGLPPLASLPCHELAAADSSPSSHAGAEKRAPSAPGDDCCQEDACRWVCGQHSATDAVSHAEHLQAVSGPQTLEMVQHRPPHLAHLIRPPIG